MDNEIYRMLGEVRGKLDAVAGHCERIEEKLDGLNGRVGKVENAQARHLGIVAGAGAILMVAWEMIRAKLDL